MVDDLDHRIVEALVGDGRRPFVRIAADLGVSEASVRQRVARLTADGVMQIMAVTNPLKLGFEVVCLLGVSVEKSEMEAAGRRLMDYPEVTYLVACTGRYDYLVEVVCRDNKHMLDFMSTELAQVPGVRSTESFGYLSVLKESYRTSPIGADS
jgi:Lrp/AsnC family transcriptional regulator, regulator for asnA, asnC and gidA